MTWLNKDTDVSFDNDGIDDSYSINTIVQEVDNSNGKRFPSSSDDDDDKKLDAKINITIDNTISTVSTNNVTTYLPSGEYIVDRNNPKTFLNPDDLEKVTNSNIFPQKHLFYFLHSKKIQPIPETLEERTVFPFYKANILSKIFMWWVTPLMGIGYKRTIQPNDLFIIHPKMSIEVLYEDFEKNLNYYKEKEFNRMKDENPNLSDIEIYSILKLPNFVVLKSLLFTFKKQYFLAVLLAILANCTSGFNPMLTKRLIKFVEMKAIEKHLKVNKGIGYAIGACVMMITNGIFFNQFFYFAQLTGVQVKSILTKAALSKSFKMTAYSKHKFPDGKINSFVSTDLNRIEFALSFQPFLAGFPAILAIAITLLVINLGAIAMAGIGVFFAAFFVTLFFFKHVIAYRIQANVLTDKRVTLMREILNAMKMVKYYAWEDAYEKNVIDVRTQEAKRVTQMQFLKNATFALAMSLPNIASLLTFLAMYKIDGSNMSNIAGIFSSLSLFQVLSLQMFFLPVAIGTGIDMILGLQRFQKLLESEEIRNGENDFIQIENGDTALKVNNCSFEWENFEIKDAEEEKKNNEKKKEKKSLFGKKKKDKKESKDDDDSKNKKYTSNDETDNNDTPFTGFDNLNFEIKKGEFIMVTGPIGTGKSSLLLALAGFMRRANHDGSIEMNGDLLLCGYPWIQNATVRDNITFGSPFDEKKYNRIIEVCSLNADLDSLPAGDLTEIGERGITLSGGQKARINLARAVYKSKDIYLFDDVLSAVDARVGKAIMDDCLLGELKDKTRILATHQLSLIERADRVIVLGKDGDFDIGTYEELSQSNETLINLLEFTSQNAKEEEEEEQELEEEELEKERIQIELQKQEQLSLKKQFTKNTTTFEITEQDSTNDENNTKPTDGHLITQEERAVNSIGWNVYKEYINSATRNHPFLYLPFYFIFIAGTTFCNLFSSVWLSYWTENKWSDRSSSYYMGMYSFFVFGSFLFMNGHYTLLCYLGVVASKALNLKAVHRIMHTPMSFMDTTPLGRILNRFTKDTDSLDNELTENLRLLGGQVANIIGVCVMCIVYLPWFAIAIPFLLFVFILIADHYQCTGREIKRLEAVQRSHVYNNLNEVLGGMDTIKSYGAEERFNAKCDFLINKMNEAGYVSVAIQRWVAIFLDLVACAFALIITLLCVTRTFHISGADTGVLLTYVLQLPGILNTVLRAVTQTENDMNSAERLVAYATDLPQEATYRKPETAPSESWPENGEIIFEDVDFAYRPGLPNILKKLNLTVNSGEKIGICGRTGAGKSTIMSALYRLNEISGGHIYIDGIDTANLGLFELRSKLAIIPQDPVLFAGTIRKNLDPFDDHTDDLLWDSLIRGGAIEAEELSKIKPQKPDEKGSYLNMHKFHLDQIVDEEGSNFSLGERQILALTRALVRQSKILILDEATSSVDYKTDDKIQKLIASAFNECTILCIAHRLKTILNYDKILVLEKGEIAEFDTPLNLFLKGGIFTSMCGRAGIIQDDFDFLTNQN